MRRYPGSRPRRRRHSPQRRQRWINWWVLWRIPVLMLALMLAWWFVYRPFAETRGEWIEITQRFSICPRGGMASACTIDGDTVTIGRGSGARRIRLTGFDAPEIDGACATEKAKAREAEQALHRWLNAGPFEWSGGTSPPRDRYGRELRSARRERPDGTREKLADVMIGAGLAEGPAPWQRRDWCG